MELVHLHLQVIDRHARHPQKVVIPPRVVVPYLHHIKVVWASRFNVWGLKSGFNVWGLGSGLKVWCLGSGFKVWCLGSVWPAGRG